MRRGASSERFYDLPSAREVEPDETDGVPPVGLIGKHLPKAFLGLLALRKNSSTLWHCHVARP